MRYPTFKWSNKSQYSPHQLQQHEYSKPWPSNKPRAAKGFSQVLEGGGDLKQVSYKNHEYYKPWPSNKPGAVKVFSSSLGVGIIEFIKSKV